jgi:benzodiazapine receptor
MATPLSLSAPRRMPAALGLGVSLAACYGAAALGTLASAPELGGWYARLAKPPWNPPNAVFGPVWTGLYGLMAVAAWRVWRKRAGRRTSGALALFGVQLGLNLAWSWIFFGGHAPGAAAFEIVLLAVVIAATLRAFRPLDRVAALMLVPYLAWVVFAAGLNIAIWRLN